MGGAPSAPKPPSERDIAIETRAKQITQERSAAGEKRLPGRILKLKAKSDPQFKEVGISQKTISERGARQTRRASRTGAGGSTIATSALGLGNNGGARSSVLTGGA